MQLRARTSPSLRAGQRGRSIGHFDALEPRQLLAQTSIFTDPVGGDQWEIKLTGPGTFTTTQGVEGLRLLALTGTTTASNLTINQPAPFKARGPGSTLSINLITGNIIGSITADPNGVSFDPENGLGGNSGIDLDGYAKTIDVGDLLAGSDIKLRGTTSANRSSITIRRAFGANVALARGVLSSESLIFSGGVIDSFTANRLVDATVEAERIGSLEVRGDPTLTSRGVPDPTDSFDILTHSTSASYGVKTISVNGILADSFWTIASNVQKIFVNSVFIPPPEPPKFARGVFGSEGLELDVTGRVDVTTFAETAFGRLTAKSFGSITVNGFMNANVTANGPTSNTVNSIDSLRSTIISGVTISAPNGVGLLNTGRIEDSTVNVGWLGFFNVTGTPGGDIEDFASTSVSLSNQSRSSVLTKMNVQGLMASSQVFANNNLGDIVLHGMTNSSIRTGALQLANAPGDFSAQYKINSFTISPLVSGATNFSNSIVVAAIVGSLKLNLKVAVNSAVVPFGFSFDTIQASTFTLFDSGGVQFANGGGASNAGTLASSGQFVLKAV